MIVSFNLTWFSQNRFLGSKNVLEINTLSTQYGNPWINPIAFQTECYWFGGGQALALLCLSWRDSPDAETQPPVSSCNIWSCWEVPVISHLPVTVLFQLLKLSSTSLVIGLHFQIKPANLESSFGSSAWLFFPFHRSLWKTVIILVLFYWMEPLRNRQLMLMSSHS